jgi:hypothetical protein
MYLWYVCFKNNVSRIKETMFVMFKLTDTPPKSSRHEESPDMLKNSSTGIYKALVPSKVCACFIIRYVALGFILIVVIFNRYS